MNAEYISNGIKNKFQVDISYKKEIQYQNSSLFSLTAHRGGQRILIYPIHTLNHASFFCYSNILSYDEKSCVERLPIWNSILPLYIQI